MTAEDEFLIENGLSPEAPAEAELPKRKRGGRPKFVPSETFTEALGKLSPPHGQFVRSRLAGLSIAASYRSAFPTCAPTTATKGGQKLMSNRPIQDAIRLGQSELGRELALAVRYDLEEAHKEINRHIAGAVKAEQWNAVSSLVREKLKLHKLIETKDSTVAQAGFTIVINSADGQSKIIGAEDVAA